MNIAARLSNGVKGQQNAAKLWDGSKWHAALHCKFAASIISVMGRSPKTRQPWQRRFVAWTHRHRTATGLTGAAVALGMTALWLVVVPEKANQTAALQEFAIRWGHPLCWAFLAVAGVLFALDSPKRVRNGFCWAAAGSYAAFLAGLML